LVLLAETGLRNLATVPAGFLTDNYGRCRFIIAALAASLVIPLFVWTGSFAQVLLIRCIIGLASAFLSPAMGALMADTVPSATRGRVMAAIGRGSVMIGGASGGIGGPGTGYLITGPLAAASLAGGALYAWDPVSPFLAVFGLTLLALIVAFLSMRDPHDAEA
jgi:MFS family permease